MGRLKYPEVFQHDLITDVPVKNLKALQDPEEVSIWSGTRFCSLWLRGQSIRSHLNPVSSSAGFLVPTFLVCSKSQK